MNILILSVGTRNKIVQYFKKTLGNTGKVIATDMRETAPAIYDADYYYVVPRITDPSYIDCVLDICKNESIDGVLSLIDPELSLLAANSSRFMEIGVQVIGSPEKQCKVSLDKWKMYCWLNDHGYLCAKTFLNIDEFIAAHENKEVSFPVFIKPRYGSASISISVAEDMDTVRLLYQKQNDLLIQQYLNGQEIGVDVYIDMISEEVVSIFSKKKLLMRAGETDKARSFKENRLFDLIKRFASEFGYLGPIDIDVFEEDGCYYISEVNPRFGGGYPHAYECGINHMEMICNNLKGRANSSTIGNYKSGVLMMKYNEIRIVDNE